MMSTTSSASSLVAVSLRSNLALACVQTQSITSLLPPPRPPTLFQENTNYRGSLLPDESIQMQQLTSVSLIKDSSCRVVMGVESAECDWALRER